MAGLEHVLPARRALRMSGLSRPPRPSGVVSGLSLGVAALAIVGAAAVWGHARIAAEVERQNAAQLLAVRDTAVRGVTAFLEGSERVAAVVAEAPAVRAAVRGEGTFGAALAPFLRAGKLSGYLVADGRGVVLESTAGLPASGEQLPADTLPGIGSGQPELPRAGRPFRGADGRVRMLVAVRVAEASSPARFLGLAVDHADLSAPLLAARAGRTGETYAIDATGLMISSSRFPQHLRRAGLLGPNDDDSALRVEIRDPGGDLTAGFRAETLRHAQPLTRSAAGAVAGVAGASVEAYRDYRGVPVVGAWVWLPARGMGIISELDAAEAFEPLGALERVFGALLALLGAAVAGTGVAALLAARAGGRAARAERQFRQLGEYVVERKLGSGGMGEVYLARHAFLRRPTALKLLRPEKHDRIALERFEREVQVTASLSHPNTVAIYDYGGSEDGCFYYAMEFLEGMDLERFVARFGPSPDARVVHILRQVYGSLAEAHAMGLVHRDIKPANLFLCRRGGVPDLVKVLDFGLARLADGSRVTQANVVLGTPENMAPELFESAENATVLSDIYAVGCVGYYLLTGRRVFETASLAELCNAHLSAVPVPPSQRLGRPVDSVLERLLLASLAKEPSRRPRSVREILALLDRSAVALRWTVADAIAFWSEHEGRMTSDGDGAGQTEAQKPA